MKISQLRQLIAVSACGSINKAAGKLYISQSALVSSINAAEAEVGQPILIRSYNGIALTEYGKTFVDGAQSILSIYDSLLQAAEPQQVLPLRVSCQFLRFASAIFADICTDYVEDAASLRFAEKTRDMVCQDLMNGVSDIGIIVVPASSRASVIRAMEENGIEYHIIDSPKACCMVGPKNPLYEKVDSGVTLEELSGYPLLQYEMSEWLWGKGTFAEETDEFPHRGILTISDSGSFQRMLARTNSYFIGVYGKKAYSSTAFYENIRVLELADTSFRFDIIWLRRKDYVLNSLSRLFLRRVYEAAGKRPEPGL